MATALAAHATDVVITSQQVNVYATPDMSSTVVGTLRNNDVCMASDWVLVMTPDGKRGWIPTTAIRPVCVESVTPASSVTVPAAGQPAVQTPVANGTTTTVGTEFRPMTTAEYS